MNPFAGSNRCCETGPRRPPNRSGTMRDDSSKSALSVVGCVKPPVVWPRRRLGALHAPNDRRSLTRMIKEALEFSNSPLFIIVEKTILRTHFLGILWPG